MTRPFFGTYFKDFWRAVILRIPFYLCPNHRSRERHYLRRRSCIVPKLFPQFDVHTVALKRNYRHLCSCKQTNESPNNGFEFQPLNLKIARHYLYSAVMNKFRRGCMNVRRNKNGRFLHLKTSNFGHDSLGTK